MSRAFCCSQSNPLFHFFFVIANICIIEANNKTLDNKDRKRRKIQFVCKNTPLKNVNDDDDDNNKQKSDGKEKSYQANVELFIV